MPSAKETAEGGRTSTDRITKRVVLHAARARVWRAIANGEEFSAWFGVKFDRPFMAGAVLRGIIVPTSVDAEVAKGQQPYAGMSFEITVERMEPEHLFAFRWHPYAVEPGVDYSHEPTTIVVFTLEDVADGTLLTVTESGFDHVPLARRAKAFKANEAGWTVQMMLIEKYLARAA